MTDFKNVREAIKRLPEEKQEIANALCEKAEFMDAQLLILQESLEKKGWTEEYYNGRNQSGIKKSSEAEVYNNLIKNFNTTMKAILDMLPEGTNEDDPAEGFFK